MALSANHIRHNKSSIRATSPHTILLQFSHTTKFSNTSFGHTSFHHANCCYEMFIKAMNGCGIIGSMIALGGYLVLNSRSIEVEGLGLQPDYQSENHHSHHYVKIIQSTWCSNFIKPCLESNWFSSSSTQIIAYLGELSNWSMHMQNLHSLMSHT